MTEAEQKSEELFEEFKLSDIVAVMRTREGRRSMAAILELLMHEESALASNAARLSANAARQDVAYRIKNMIWIGGGKALWRTMEDEIELREESEDAHEKQQEEHDSLDLE